MTIKVLEHLIGCLDEFVIGRKGIRKLGGTAKQCLQDLAPVGLGQRLKGLQEMSGCVSHGRIILHQFLSGLTSW
jgi:hypothetical protein